MSISCSSRTSYSDRVVYPINRSKFPGILEYWESWMHMEKWSKGWAVVAREACLDSWSKDSCSGRCEWYQQIGSNCDGLKSREPCDPRIDKCWLHHIQWLMHPSGVLRPDYLGPLQDNSDRQYMPQWSVELASTLCLRNITVSLSALSQVLISNNQPASALTSRQLNLQHVVSLWWYGWFCFVYHAWHSFCFLDLWICSFH